MSLKGIFLYSHSCTNICTKCFKYLPERSFLNLCAKKRWAHYRPGGGGSEGGHASRCILKTKPVQNLLLYTDARDMTRVSSDSSISRMRTDGKYNAGSCLYLVFVLRTFFHIMPMCGVLSRLLNNKHVCRRILLYITEVSDGNILFIKNN